MGVQSLFGDVGNAIAFGMWECDRFWECGDAIAVWVCGDAIAKH